MKYPIADIQRVTVIIKPFVEDDFKKSVEVAWVEYKSGNYLTREELKKKYYVLCGG